MRAPAMYSSVGSPGTLEISTLPGGGMRSASPERPNSVAMLDISHGEPSSGTSALSSGLIALTIAFASSDDAWIARNRCSGSAMSVARSTRIDDTWLFIELSSGERRLTGTIAISGLSGSSPRSSRYLRTADAHIAITTVLTVPPTRLPSAFISSSDCDIVTYERWLVIDTLSGVRGAAPRFRLRPPGPVPGRDIKRLMLPIDRAACGSSWPSLVYCTRAFSTEARSSSATPSWYGLDPALRRGGGGTSRTFGEVS